jgi:hypothetical protein
MNAGAAFLRYQSLHPTDESAPFFSIATLIPARIEREF